MEDSVRAQMIPLLNSQLRLRKSIHMGRLQTWSNALIKIILEEKNYGISAWFLCFPPLWQCLCQCRVWERATKAAENMLHSGNASLSWAAVLWAGAETVYFVIMPLRCLVCPCAQPREGDPLPSLNIYLEAGSESAWKDNFKLPHEVDREPIHC